MVKRDDMSGGVELGGNKIRRIEFLLADALQTGCDCVVTIGGSDQSNQCRATAVASRMVGLEPHLILRTCDKKVDCNTKLGYTGSLLYGRMAGARIHTVTKDEYTRIGSTALLDIVCNKLRSEGKKPYPIPVRSQGKTPDAPPAGGTKNAIGTWGYIEAARELKDQMQASQQKLDHIVLACGSGGTIAGLTIGIALAYANEVHKPKVHGIGVCNDPDYFYREVYHIGKDLGMFADVSREEGLNEVKEWVTIYQGQGLGYATSAPEELSFCRQFCWDTGISLDPVYSGKALYHFMTNVLPNDVTGQFEGDSDNIIFWHTGGSLGLFDKCDEMQNDLLENSPLHRVEIE